MMVGYWSRHRLIQTLILTVFLAVIIGLLFVFPCINQQAANYNSQSIFKNTNIDFIVPEPSEKQVLELPGTNGISKVFPFFLTKTQVCINGKTRTSTILLSDKFENIDITMYNDTRLIEKADNNFANPIWVDWQFCRDTAANIGDVISLAIADTTTEYTISAIYETNDIYDGGAILIQISTEQKNAIMERSRNNGYSGMYVSAGDYGMCQTFLTTEYRPIGRLKDRSQFNSEEQYRIHYDAIMSSDYANEITDFRIKESNLDTNSSYMMLLLGVLFTAVTIVAFNSVMSQRGCEKVYFSKHCIPRGQNVSTYYIISAGCETLLLLLVYAVTVLIRIKLSSQFIPSMVLNINLIAVPMAILISEGISLFLNNWLLKGITNAVRNEQGKTEVE